MPLALVATAGAADANAYNSLDELQVEADLCVPPLLVWEMADDTVKVRAAIAAARVLDQMRWRGTRVGSSQALEHPRAGLPGPGGSCYDTTAIATPVKRAHAQLTFHLVSEEAAERNPFAGAEDAGVSSISFGQELTMTFERGATSVMPLERFLRQVIRPMLRGLVLTQAEALR